MRRKKEKKKREGKFNWQELEEKMAKFSLVLNAKLDPATLDAKLTERAEQLAKASSILDSDQSENLSDFLIFDLGSDNYAIETSHIAEVMPLKLVTFVPSAPDYIYGVVSRRGEIISVVDLGKLLNIKQEEHCEDLIFVESGDTQIGLAVRRIQEIVGISKKSILNLQSQLLSEQAQFLAGVTEIGIVILDVDKLLSSSQLNLD